MVVGDNEREGGERETTGEHETRATGDADGLAQRSSDEAHDSNVDKQASAESQTSETSAEDDDEEDSDGDVLSSTPDETLGQKLEKAGVRTGGEESLMTSHASSESEKFYLLTCFKIYFTNAQNFKRHFTCIFCIQICLRCLMGKEYIYHTCRPLKIRTDGGHA